LKRGLEEELVVDRTHLTCADCSARKKLGRYLDLLSDKGFEGRYGFYEAINESASRCRERAKTNAKLFNSFMAHKSGDEFCSHLAYLLLEQLSEIILRRRHSQQPMLLRAHTKSKPPTLAHTLHIFEIKLKWPYCHKTKYFMTLTLQSEVQFSPMAIYHVNGDYSGGGLPAVGKMALIAGERHRNP